LVRLELEHAWDAVLVALVYARGCSWVLPLCDASALLGGEAFARSPTSLLRVTSHRRRRSASHAHRPASFAAGWEVLAFSRTRVNFWFGLEQVCDPGHHPGQHELASWYHPGRLSWLPPWRPSSYQNVTILLAACRCGTPYHPTRMLPSSYQNVAIIWSWCPRGVIILASSCPASAVTPSSWRHPGHAAAEKVKIQKSWLLEVWSSIILGL
jgi:hypothetical protein